MIWYDMIWYDMIWYDMLWYDMIWYDMIWYDMMVLSSIVCLGYIQTNHLQIPSHEKLVYDILHEVSFLVWYTHRVCEEWMY